MRSAISNAALVALAAVACQVKGDTDGLDLTCTDECPNDLMCIEGRCVAERPIDGGAVDGPTPDAEDCTCEAVTFADDCGANVVDIGANERVCASTEQNTNAILGCPGAPQPGFDAAFRLSAMAGQTITATVQPTGFDVSVYITRDCAGTCVEIADDVGLSGTETVTATAATTGDYFVIVDSPSGSGCYDLSVSVQ